MEHNGMGGIGLGYASVSGYKGGTAAGKAAAATDEPHYNAAETERLRKQIYAPLEIKEGNSPYDAIKEIAYRYDHVIVPGRDYLFDYFGLKTMQKVYLNEGETPQYMFLRGHGVLARNQGLYPSDYAGSGCTGLFAFTTTSKETRSLSLIQWR
jgi:hypothetical protein